MRIIIIGVAFLLALPMLEARAQEGRITGAEMTWYGTYSVSQTREAEDKGSATGTRYVSTLRRQTGDNTDEIELREDLHFGFGFKLSGHPRDAVVPIDYVYLYPSPGIRNEATGERVRRDRSHYSFRIDRDDLYIGYRVGDMDGVPEGIWTMQVVYRGRVLAEKSFFVHRP